jgi:hypothetical protein
LGKTPYQVNVCSAERDCELLLISRNDLLRVFSEAELIKIRTLKMIQFPTEEEVRNRIQTIEKVVNMKKTAFLNSVNTNFLPKAMRDFYLDPVTKKLYKWVQGINSRTQVKLNTALEQKEKLDPPKQGVTYTEREKDFVMPSTDKSMKVISRKER